MESKKSNGSAMFLANGAPVRYGLILGTPLIIIRVSGVRVLRQLALEGSKITPHPAVHV